MNGSRRMSKGAGRKGAPLEDTGNARGLAGLHKSGLSFFWGGGICQITKGA